MAARKRPAKPRKDFPLFPHRNGQWAKKVLGRLRYFGTWDDPDGALEKWLAEKDHLLAGREPPRHQQEGVVTVNDLCLHFVRSKTRQVKEKELSPRTFKDYLATVKRLIDCCGKTVAVDSLTASDFAKVRSSIGSKSPVSIKNEMQRIRSIFNWGQASKLIGPVTFGPDFTPPSRRQMRKQRQASQYRLFTPQQLRAIVKHADVHLRAMVLLGINCGWGNNDVASVPISAINLTAAMADFPRPKTSIERRAPLWPETVTALRESFASRREPIDDADAGLFFLTTFGRQYVRQREEGAWIDSVGLQFGKLLRRLKIKRPGVNFYSLRHTFRTIADECEDRPAIERIMGHETPGMGTVYREWKRDQRENERLRRITNHVRDWMFPERFRRKDSVSEIE